VLTDPEAGSRKWYFQQYFSEPTGRPLTKVCRTLGKKKILLSSPTLNAQEMNKSFQ
jgi:hypothetical protein